MGTTYEDAVTDFVSRQLDLLECERKEEYEQSMRLFTTSEGAVCLKNVTAFSYISCLGGYVIVEFRSARNSVLQVHNLTRRDVVGVIEGSNIRSTPLATGVVKFSTDESIGVSFEDISSFSEENGVVYTLVKLANDITYSRLKSSLKDLTHISKPGKVLVELLFGKSNCLERIPLTPLMLDAQGELMYINVNLHEDQKEAVKFALEMKNLAVIHGPPGTGKTTTLVEIILHMIQARNKVLVCAPSNIAVDNLVERLASHNVKMVRLGHPGCVMDSVARYSLDAVVDRSSSTQIVKDIQKELNDVLKKLKTRHRKETFSELHKELKNLRKELHQRESRALKEVLQGSDVVLSTLVTASDAGPLKYVPEDHFHCVVIDECSQALEAACWIVLPRAPKAILAGDHLQLPPTVISQKAERGGLGLSLMERAVEKFAKEGYRLLQRQFRMHTDIMTWPSQEMYGGQLEADPSVGSHLLKDLPLVKSTDETEMSILLVDTAGYHLEEEMFETSRCNRGEAGIIAILIKRLVAANVPQTSVAVITPYNYQVEMIRAHIPHLNGIEVRSVDGFQGREKEAILCSMVRSNSQRELGFICDRRRLNVAVSRARRFLCVVADSSTVSCDSTLASLIDYIEQHGVVHSAGQYLSELETPKEVLQNPKFQFQKKIKSEMGNDKKSKKAKKKIVDVQEKQAVNVDREKKDTQQAKNEQVKEDYYQSFLQEFVRNNEQMELKFPKSISAYDRKLIHEAASKLNLLHISVGEGNDRHIVVHKAVADRPSVGNVNITKKPNNNLKVKVKEPNDSSNEQVKCNVEHATRASAEESAPGPSELREMKKTECKKSEKVSKKSKKKQELEDFDSIIEEFKEMDKRCLWSSCRIATDLVGLTCAHCKQRFCISHGFPEVHGCGEAARKTAKHEFRHPKPTKPDPLKRSAVSKKLEKKLAQMAEERKRQKKET
ncbi:DNA-binding protein SMUBP-2 [Cryptotermes secundus]|uniref:DNA-binding protein SMUBP-2 n=1 Tax=Cryptotermes secundus TaxID=105785 RepID=A0A2J7QUY5_9NEOP|nr:DNA-binding protein SMUBP-2 [Cryptotermes secundus]PNF32400.1 DNA-binding protein SMUBP-2 [Cryptotermes secundus]